MGYSQPPWEVKACYNPDLTDEELRDSGKTSINFGSPLSVSHISLFLDSAVKLGLRRMEDPGVLCKEGTFQSHNWQDSSNHSEILQLRLSKFIY